MTRDDPPLGLRVAPHLAVVSVGYVMFGYAGVPDFYLNRYDIGYASFGLVLSATLLPFVLVRWPASRLVERTTTTRLLIVATVVQAGLASTGDFARARRGHIRPDRRDQRGVRERFLGG